MAVHDGELVQSIGMSTEETIEEVTNTLDRVNARWDELSYETQQSTKELEEYTKAFVAKLKSQFKN